MKRLDAQQTQSALRKLAVQINREQAAVERHLKASVAHALAMGQLLIKAKFLVKHSQWRDWLQTNCPDVAERTAQAYMCIARNAQRVADLGQVSLREALQVLRGNHYQQDVLFSSKSVEYYTPADIVARVQAVLGEIDLDPCSDPGHHIPAKQHFTRKDNGLAKPWRGRVYLNPPYGKQIADFIKKLISEYKSGQVTEAIALLPDHTMRRWFGSLRDYPRCHVHGALNFLATDTKGKSPDGTVMFYLGTNVRKFYEVFSEIGDVYGRFRSADEAERFGGAKVAAITAEAKRPRAAA
jgi:hypothetical protein